MNLPLTSNYCAFASPFCRVSFFSHASTLSLILYIPDHIYSVSCLLKCLLSRFQIIFAALSVGAIFHKALMPGLKTPCYSTCKAARSSRPRGKHHNTVLVKHYLALKMHLVQLFPVLLGTTLSLFCRLKGR